MDPPTEEEIISSIKAMKSGKAGGKDRVTADMLFENRIKQIPRKFCGLLKAFEGYTGIFLAKSFFIMVYHQKLLISLRCSILTSLHRSYVEIILSEAFQVTGVKQGCILSYFLFILGINWVMNKATMEGSHSLCWTSFGTLDLRFQE